MVRFSTRHQAKSDNVQPRYSAKTHLLIKVYEGLVWQLEGLDGLQDSVPVAAVDICHKALDTVHCVQGHRGLLLQRGQRPVKVVFFQVLHYQTNHAVRNRDGVRQAADG